jgi:hypothetical protein
MKHFLFEPGRLPTQGIMPASPNPLNMAIGIEQLTRDEDLSLRPLPTPEKTQTDRLAYGENPADGACGKSAANPRKLQCSNADGN